MIAQHMVTQVLPKAAKAREFLWCDYAQNEVGTYNATPSWQAPI